MIEMQYIGTAYEAGFQCGKQMLEKGISLREVCQSIQHPLRHTYACVCEEVYETYDKNLVEEIKGFADGQGIPYDIVRNFILGMYAFPMPIRCSCFAIKGEHGVVFARNSDFMCEVNKESLSSYYALDNHISFIGNTTFPGQIEDGVNAYGLAIGLTFLPPILRGVGMHAGFLVRYLLEHCENVTQAIALLQEVPIGSSQTLTMADRSGRLVVVECNPQQLHIHEDEDYVYAVNRYYAQEMMKYNVEGIDDLKSDVRHQTLKQALKNKERYSLSFAREIVEGKHGFLCQYDQENGFDTIWSSLYDLNHHEIYRCDGNPSRNPFFKDERLSFVYE